MMAMLSNDGHETPQKPLAGARILVVEDCFLILVDLERTLLQAGASAVICCGTIEQAVVAVDDEVLDVAVLDVRIGRSTIAPVAEKLANHGKLFIFYTGQSAVDSELARWPHIALVSKPAPPELIIQALVRTMQTPQLQSPSRQPQATHSTSPKPGSAAT